MRLLLDTCTFLWVASGDERLSQAAVLGVGDPANEVYVSAVSAWEIATKYTLGKLVLPEPPDTYIPKIREQHGLLPLPLDERAALSLCRLPALHRDPFDRMLVCQAIIGGLTIVTPDEDVRRYPAPALW